MGKIISVLVVDDDVNVPKIYTPKFLREGFHTLFAQSGPQAMEILKTFKPDIILLDLVMPGIDGYATLELIKADHDLSDIPVVILSNLSDSAYKNIGDRLGSVEVLVKSNTSLEQIVQKIKQYTKA